MAKHFELTEPNAIHPAAFVGNTDPALVAANDVLADKLWIDTTLPAPYILKKRDATNTFWEVVGGGTGGFSSFGASSGPLPFEHEEPEMPWINPGGGGGGSSAPVLNHAARAARTTNQSIADNSADAIIFDSVTFDTSSFWAGGAPTRLTIPATGVYVINFDAAFANNGTGYRALRIRVDGATTIAELHLQPNGTLNDHLNVSAIYKFTAAQYLEFICIQTSGGPLNMLTASDYSARAGVAYICAG